MGISVFCAGCNKTFSLKPELAGKRVRCKQCNSVLTVPAVAGEPSAPQPRVVGIPQPARPAAAASPARSAVRPPPPPPPPPTAEDDEYDLASLPVAPAAPAAQYAPAAPPPVAAEKSSWKFGASEGGSGIGKKLGSAVGVILVLLLVGYRGYRAYVRSTGDDPIGANTTTWRAKTAVATVPERPTMSNLDRCQVGTVSVTNRVGLNTTVKVYLPPGTHAAKSLAGILIAPAGSIGVVGMPLTDGDTDEHKVYAQQGFAVIAYSLSGPIKDDLDAVTDREFKVAAEQFHSTSAGVTDAQDALAFALQRFPEIDANRLGSVGHSSAGTHAMLLAQSDDRIKACCAYAPCVDFSSRLSDGMKELRKILRPIETWAVEYSPARTGSPRCPTLIVHARDDDNVPFSESASYAQKFPQQVTLAAINNGGHVGVLTAGLPQAVTFMKSKLK